MRKKDKEILNNISFTDRQTIRIVCQTVKYPMVALECYQRKYPFLFKTKENTKIFVNKSIHDYFMKTG